MEEDLNQGRLRSMSEPSDMFQVDKEGKKSGGLSHFFHKLPYLVLGKHRHHHGHSHSDDEFCDIETEMRKDEKHKKSHKSHGHETDKNEKKHEDAQRAEEEYKETEEVDVMVNDSTDTTLDHEEDEEEDERGKEKTKDDDLKPEQNTPEDATNGSCNADENGSGDSNYIKGDCTSENNLPRDDEGSHDPPGEPLHEPPSLPLPPPSRSCLKQSSCFFRSVGSNRLPPLRKRSISVPEGDPNIIFRLNRHVCFSPDTVDPTPRNCKYKEWIERHSSHGCVKANIKHEKRMQQLRQIHSLDINDYLSKGHRRYHNAMVTSPMPTLGCDIFM